MSKRRVYHVVPNAVGWAVRKEGRRRELASFGTKPEAIETARMLAGDGRLGEVIVHCRDGSIERASVDRTPGDGAAQAV